MERTEKKPVSMRLRKTVLDQLEDYSSVTGVPMTRVVERAVEDYVSHMNPGREPEQEKMPRTKRIPFSMRMRIDIYRRFCTYCEQAHRQKTLIIERALLRYIEAYRAQQGILKERYTIVRNRLKKEAVDEIRLQNLTFNPADEDFR